MIVVVGKILLGLGLMFTGVQMFSSALKQLGSRPFRILATRFVSSRARALAFGLGSGVVMQSTMAALVILANLISSGMLTVSQAITILNGFSVGNCALVLIVSLDITVGVMFLVGLCGIAMYLTKDERYRTYFLIGLGLGLIFFGIEMMVAGVKPLRQEAWFAGVMEVGRKYSFLSIMAGIMLGFIVESSTAVALVAIGLAREGILTGPQAFLSMYGATIGSTLFKAMIGQAFRGTSRQLVRFVNMFNIFGAVVFILLYYIEIYLHIPLVMALLNSFLPELDDQAAWMFLLFNMTSAIFFIAINGPLTRWLAISLPPSEEESLSFPKYLSEFKPEDPDTALELIRLEQTRELEHIAAFVSTARADYEGIVLDARYAAFKALAGEVGASLSMVATMRMPQQTARNHAYYQTRLALLDQLAESTVSGLKIIRRASRHPSLKELADACLEAMDFLLHYAADTVKANSPEQMRLLLDLSSSSGPTLEQLRKAYLDSDKLSSAKEKGYLLDLTVMMEKNIWLLNRLLVLMQNDVYISSPKN